MAPRPTSSGESWCHPSVPAPVIIEVLLPNGLMLCLRCNRDTNLETLKEIVWTEAKNEILFRLLNEPSNYIFKGVTMDTKCAEFYDESRKICDLKLFLPILSLASIPTTGVTDDKITASYINLAIGSNAPITSFDSVQDPEFNDARRSFLLLSQSVVNERSRFDDKNKFEYHFPSLLEATHDQVTRRRSLKDGAKDEELSASSGTPTKRKETLNHVFTILVPKDVIDNQTPTDGKNVACKRVDIELNLYQTPEDAIKNIFEIIKDKESKEDLNVDNYVLKVIGSNEYLTGKENNLRDYSYISKCVSSSRPGKLVLINKKELINNIPEETFIVPSFLRRSSSNSASDKSSFSSSASSSYETFQRNLNRDLEDGASHSLWKTDSPLSVYVNVATYANVRDFDQVFVVLGVYHGTEPLCEPQRTKPATPQNPKWQQMVQFNINLEDVPRGARLCVSMCSKHSASSSSASKSSKYYHPASSASSTSTLKPINENLASPISAPTTTFGNVMHDMAGSVPIAYGNIAVFDYQERLLSGKVLLSLWRLPKEHWNDLLYPLGVTGPNPDKDALSLDISFPEFNCPIIFPPDLHIKCFGDHLISLAAKNKLPGHSRASESRRLSLGSKEEQERVHELSKLDPLAQMTPADKDLMWRLRNYCEDNIPDALPKLLDAVRWNDREEVAQLYLLLWSWPPVTIVTALELLDCKYTDPKVRSFAIKSLEGSLPDHILSEYLLQLVQVALHEPYLDNDVSKFLLKRSLKNPRIGHFFFWMIKSEIHDPINGKSCSLLLEAFLRGVSPNYMKSLIKQVEALDKLTTITNILKEKRASDVKERLHILKEYLNQTDFVSVLNHVNSPLVPNEVLGQLKVEDCRIMDSAKRPLWLVWSNGDNFVDDLNHEEKVLSPLAPSSASLSDIKIIFKNGDDLRQDMLTLQVIKIMDSIWRSEGLDLKMSPYTCRSTGHMIGLIEVVKDARTVMNIQKSLSVLAGFQIGSKELYKWFERSDAAKYERLMENFTKSCAGYCVATFVLGIGDRNPDNIMINDDGQIFHIDFGHFLGHFKKKFGINRERVPFVLTDDFLFVICRGKEPSPQNENLKKFNELCEKAYLILRKHANLFITLFTLMLSTGIPELQSPDDVAFLRSKLQVDLKLRFNDPVEDEKAALKYFKYQLNEARAGSTYTKLDWFFHAVQHARAKN